MDKRGLNIGVIVLDDSLGTINSCLCGEQTTAFFGGVQQLFPPPHSKYSQQSVRISPPDIKVVVLLLMLNIEVREGKKEIERDGNRMEDDS